MLNDGSSITFDPTHNADGGWYLERILGFWRCGLDLLVDAIGILPIIAELLVPISAGGQGKLN